MDPFAGGKEPEIFLTFINIVLERAYYFSYISTFTYLIMKVFFGIMNIVAAKYCFELSSQYFVI